MVQKFLAVKHSEHLYRVRHEIFQLCQCLYTMIQTVFLWYKVLSVFKHNVFILKFHGFMFLLDLITSKFSFFRRVAYLGMVLVFPDMPSFCQKLSSLTSLG